MTTLTRYGGIAASIILIAFGLGSIYSGIDGRDTVRDNLRQEQIVGTPDSEIPGQLVDSGSEARKFANVIRKHTLAATDGQTYAQMARFIGKDGKPTNDEAAAKVDPDSGEPMENGARNIWVTSTALSTALNTAYFAEQVALFSLIMGIALLLTGIGFAIVSLQLLRRREPTA